VVIRDPEIANLTCVLIGSDLRLIGSDLGV